MSYLGNTPTQQNFVAGADQFSGTGSQLAFTLSRNVNTVFDIFVTVSNVPQDPFTAYTVAGNTLTFDGAPPAGTNNIDVVYRATNVQTFVPSPGVSVQFGLGSAASPSMTFIGDTNTGIYSPAADTIAFATAGTEDFRIASAGQLGIGGANYGTAGQVLTSGGPSAAPSWAAVTSVLPGTVMFFAASTAPTGYLECNGASLSTTTYAALFAVIGYVYGGSGASFSLPDLRGEFIRGWDNGRGIDPSRAFGSFQDAQTQQYKSVFIETNSQGFYNGGPFNGDGWNRSVNSSSFTMRRIDQTYQTNLETRPRNRALLPCIKF